MTKDVNVDAMLAEDNRSQKLGESAKEKKEVDMTKFLQVFPEQGKDSKDITIRLLPITEEGGVFEVLHCHDMTVVPSPMFSKSRFKTFICPSQEKDEAGAPKKCPICEANQYYWDLYHSAEKKQKEAKANNQTDLVNKLEQEMKELKEYAGNYRRKDYYQIRCIDRDHEEEGVKFWRFPASTKGDGIYDKIMTVWRMAYKEKIDRKGPDDESNWEKANIFRLDAEGYDLRIHIELVDDPNRKGQKKRVFSVSTEKKPCALCDDEATAEAWINDPIKWSDLYSVKSYDYLNAVLKSGGKAPIWNPETKSFVPDLGGATAKVSETPKAEPVIPTPTVNPTVAPTTAPVTAKAPTAPAEPTASEEGEDDNLPF